MKTFIISLMLCVSFGVNAGVSSQEKARAFSVAKQGMEILAKSLPMQVNELQTLEGAAFIGSTALLSIRYSFNKAPLLDVLKAEGLTMEQVDKEGKEEIKTRVCSTPSLLKFVNAGGTVKYQMYYLNGEYQSSLSINSCK